MTTYKPYGIKDFQNWNKIREIDAVNLTVTAERGVTLGELEDAVNEYGLHMAAMTEDLRDVTLGVFFAEQMLSLTSLRYNQPRYQVLGLEVMLADGTVLQVAGKTVKNVTGYDMCRFYISSRETLAIPLAFTIKLISQEPMQAVMEAPIADTAVLMELVRGLRQQKLNPKVCVYWNAAAAKQIEQTGGRLMMVCSGSAERLQRDLWEICKLAEALQIDLKINEQPEELWRGLQQLRSRTIWNDGIKVPSLQCDVMLQELEQNNIGCWYSPMQGSMQLIPQQADAEVYRQLCEAAGRLGGCGNWYYQYQYGFAPAGAAKIWQQLKEKFDAEGRLNPVQKGGVQYGN
ncbi:MAG: FAD-binding oxidoreductase [Peptococcaceae bacterium]|nr:FAD-binding oxidoreductase [Peptococcaceae bacterium]